MLLTCPLLREALYLTALFRALKHQRTDREAYTKWVSVLIQIAGLPPNEASFFYESVSSWRW